MMLRRRAGPLAQIAMSVALSCGAADARYVFASRHGELGRTVGILGTVAEDEMPSPSEFSMSVHHAIAGLLSIYAENRLGHTAIAAGPDTFGFGFMEALSLISADLKTPVLLVYYDAPLPEEYAELDTPGEELPLVLALRFDNSPIADQKFLFSASASTTEKGVDQVEATSAPHDFLRFLLAGTPELVSRGERMEWRWSRAG
jgi:hypothetical protein